MTVPLLCASLHCVRMVQCVRPISWWGWDWDLNSGAAGCYRLTLCFINVLCFNISGVLIAACGFWCCSFAAAAVWSCREHSSRHFSEISWPKERDSACRPDPDRSLCVWGSLPWIISTGNLYPGVEVLKQFFLYIYLLFSGMCMYVCAYMYMREHICTWICVCVFVSIMTSDSQKTQFSPTPWVPRTELTLSVFLPSAFTHLTNLKFRSSKNPCLPFPCADGYP